MFRTDSPPPGYGGSVIRESQTESWIMEIESLTRTTLVVKPDRNSTVTFTKYI